MNSTEKPIFIAAFTAQKDGGKQIVGKGVRFERIRRITGYLVGTIDRFNNAKRAEVRDRVTHCKIDKGWSDADGK